MSESLASDPGTSAALLSALENHARAARPIGPELARRLLDDDLPLERLIEIASLPRERFFGRRVQIHVLNNIRNGHCPEDCGYCAQRKTAPADSISAYPEKSETEIMEEAEAAYRSGAFRYCLVSAGRGPSAQSVERLARVIEKIKATYPLEICLSAGILTNPDLARRLSDAGLDRYNHNLNTSEAHYDQITTTHTYADREETLENLSGAGVGLCSGVIAGMGEGRADMVAAACRLSELGVASIPVNFFIPVPGHALEEPRALTPEECLRLLVLFRLTNPRAEVRMAAGREIHLKARQAEGLRVANSLFVSGYLNVKGSQARETLAMILDAGFEPDLQGSDRPAELAAILEDLGATAPAAAAPVAAPTAPSSSPAPAATFAMKNLDDLRPYREQ